MVAGDEGHVEVPDGEELHEGGDCGGWNRDTQCLRRVINQGCRLGGVDAVVEELGARSRVEVEQVERQGVGGVLELLLVEGLGVAEVAHVVARQVRHGLVHLGCNLIGDAEVTVDGFVHVEQVVSERCRHRGGVVGKARSSLVACALDEAGGGRTYQDSGDYGC